ncbi:MAG: hypothetical protein EXR86_07215 [Gammaproteobacteria bacterium]|nr:hypothetical protein [Gammaproteobacteria bacterium]
MSHAAVFLPDLSITDARTLADRSVEYPLLASLLGCAELFPHSEPLEYTLCKYFGSISPFPLAYYTALHDLAERSGNSDLVRGDPVHLHADPNKVLLLGPEQLDLTLAEADALLAHLQREFPANAWQRGASPLRWYLQRPPTVLADGPPTQWISGRSLTPFIPSDPEHRDLRRWLNDIQMTLHDHPVNQARAARGARPINGVWMFGEGSVPSASTAYVYGVGNDVLLAGLSKCHQVPHAYAPTPRAALSASGSRDLILMTGTGFGVANSNHPTVTTQATNDSWLPALLKALRLRRLERLNFYTATHVARLTWSSSWRVWRKPISFELR